MLVFNVPHPPFSITLSGCVYTRAPNSKAVPVALSPVSLLDCWHLATNNLADRLRLADFRRDHRLLRLDSLPGPVVDLQASVEKTGKAYCAHISWKPPVPTDLSLEFPVQYFSVSVRCK